MSAYFLMPHVYPCRTEDGVVFLDLKRGRYLAIGKEHQHLLQSSVEEGAAGHGGVGGERVAGSLEALLKSNVLTRDARLGKRLSWLALTMTRSIPFVEVVEARAHVGHVLSMLRAWLIATYQLRYWSMERIVHRVRRRKERRLAQLPGDREAHARSLASIFCRLRPFVFTSREACLLDSLVLVEFLASYNLFPTWVFGVRTQPFYAHSWVQEDDLVLNDSADNVKAFSPILTI